MFVLVPDVTEQEVDPTVRQRDFIGSVGIRYGSVRIPVYFLVGDIDARQRFMSFCVIDMSLHCLPECGSGEKQQNKNQDI